MILDLQKANMWKRISAYLFDTILLGIAAVGLAFLRSNILGYDYYSNKLNEAYQKYALEYGVDFEISAADYELLSDEEIRLYDDAIKAIAMKIRELMAHQQVVDKATKTMRKLRYSDIAILTRSIKRSTN